MIAMHHCYHNYLIACVVLLILSVIDFDRQLRLQQLVLQSSGITEAFLEKILADSDLWMIICRTYGTLQSATH